MSLYDALNTLRLLYLHGHITLPDLFTTIEETLTEDVEHYEAIIRWLFAAPGGSNAVRYDC